MMPKKKVKVLLLDSTKIDNANFLTTYLRSFAIDVVKSSTLDENIYHDIETLYIVANQNNSSWLLKLGTYTKKVPVVILLDRGEKLQTKLTHIVDKVIYNPLFPSVISKHLASVHNINLQSKRKVKLVSKEKINVLVVEDNLINQRLIQIMLKEYNAVVSVASNGNEAVEACVNNKFDIVFMDIDMPQKNGIVATKEIKNMANLNHKTPIVALTALAMQGDRERILGEGLDDYLSKPLTRDKLSRILNKYLKVMFV
jgi:CheY-like chemotaxis protein